MAQSNNKSSADLKSVKVTRKAYAVLTEIQSRLQERGETALRQDIASDAIIEYRRNHFNQSQSGN